MARANRLAWRPITSRIAFQRDNAPAPMSALSATPLYQRSHPHSHYTSVVSDGIVCLARGLRLRSHGSVRRLRLDGVLAKSKDAPRSCTRGRCGRTGRGERATVPVTTLPAQAGSFWPEPEASAPAGASQARRMRQPSTLAPEGEGPRPCPGLCTRAVLLPNAGRPERKPDRRAPHRAEAPAHTGYILRAGLPGTAPQTYRSRCGAIYEDHKSLGRSSYAL
jgi:hypothetical protein